MTRVMASGVFDIVHSGHLHYLQEARRLGDELVVVVATDATVRRRKHEPIIPEKMRLELVSALKPVDAAVLGGEGDMFAVVENVRPDIIAIGYDQDFPAVARAVIAQVEPLQAGFQRQLGSRFAWLSDEWYLMAGLPLPPRDDYEDLPQRENGVGSIRAFLEELEEATRALPAAKGSAPS